MTLTIVLRPLSVTLAALLVLLSPLAVPGAQFGIIAIAAALTAYNGFRTRTVAPVFLALLLIEVCYGSTAGGSSLPYLIAVVVFVALQRFVALPSWADRDGWRVSDLVRTTLTGYLMSALILVVSTVIGTGAVNADGWWFRIAALGYTPALMTVLVLVPLTGVIVRRMAVPFRRAILFGQ